VAETEMINGTDLAYIEHGRGQPVVLVHGGVGDYREWDLQMPAFAASFRTIALSCRGAWPNRKLDPDEDITLDTFVDDLASFIKALDVAPIHLVASHLPAPSVACFWPTAIPSSCARWSCSSRRRFPCWASTSRPRHPKC
jgi:hypothetical protein